MGVVEMPGYCRTATRSAKITRVTALNPGVLDAPLAEW